MSPVDELCERVAALLNLVVAQALRSDVSGAPSQAWCAEGWEAAYVHHLDCVNAGQMLDEWHAQAYAEYFGT